MPASRRDSMQRAASFRSTDRTAPCGTPARSPRACASCSRRWPFSAPAATSSRPPSPPCTTTRQAPRRPTGRRSWRGMTTSSPSPTTRCSRTPPPCWGAPSRSATWWVRPRDCARPTGCARCSATATGGMRSAATCTSSTAICRPPARRTRMPRVGPQTSPSASTWSARPPSAAGRRQRERERAAPARGPLGPDASAVSFDDPAAGRKPDAAALTGTCPALEHLEDRAFLGHADAVVAHGEDPAGLAVLCRDHHPRGSAVVELQRVGDQVLKDTQHAGAARVHDRQLTDLDPRVEAVDLCRQGAEHIADDLATVHVAAVAAVIGGRRVFEDAVDESPGADGAVFEQAHHLLVFGLESRATSQ